MTYLSHNFHYYFHLIETNYDAQWRIALAMGGFPMIVAWYFRYKMHETSWKEEAKKNNEYKTIDSNNTTNNNSEKQINTSIQIQTPKLTHTQTEINILKKPETFHEYFVYFNSGLLSVFQVASKNRWKLLGTAGSWFILDIIFYSNSLFSGQVTTLIGYSNTTKQEAYGALILNVS